SLVRWLEASKLIHLPNEPAGVSVTRSLARSFQTYSPAERAGRGLGHSFVGSKLPSSFTCRTSRQGSRSLVRWLEASKLIHLPNEPAGVERPSFRSPKPSNFRHCQTSWQGTPDLYNYFSTDC